MAKQNASRLRRGLIGFAAAASLAIGLAAVTSNGARKQTPTSQSLLAADVPLPVRTILQRACQDCHSANTAWPWYSHIPPISWQIQHDVAKGRAFMDLSKWNDYSDAERQAFLVSIGAAVQSHLMPPSKYLWLHREARLSPSDLESIKAWALARVKPDAASVGP